MNQTLKNERKFRVTTASNMLFKVESKRACDCGLWQINGLSCNHAMPCIAHVRSAYNKFVAPCYLKEAYLKCYSSMIHPLPDKSKWPHVEAEEILALKVQRPPGKPKTCRRKEVDEPPTHKS